MTIYTKKITPTFGLIATYMTMLAKLSIISEQNVNLISNSNVIFMLYDHESTHSQADSISAAKSSLPIVCEQIHQRVEAFLSKEPDSERLRGVQEQCRTSLRVIEEAIERYRCVDHDSRWIEIVVESTSLTKELGREHNPLA